MGRVKTWNPEMEPEPEQEPEPELIKIKDTLMMLLTIMTYSNKLNTWDQFTSVCFFPLVLFLQRKMKHRSYHDIDFRVSYIHLKDVTIIQNIFVSVDPDKVTN